MSSLKTTNILNPSSTTNNIVLAADGSTTISTLTATTIQGTIKSGTAVASTSGTSIDFTSIPSWVKRVTVMFNGVSTGGTSNYLLQIGTSSGVENTNYISSSGALVASSYGAGSSTAGFLLTGTGPEAAGLYSGLLVVANITGNTWALSGNLGSASNSRTFVNAGSKALSGTLDRVRITTAGGTDTFDAGSINILYEG